MGATDPASAAQPVEVADLGECKYLLMMIATLKDLLEEPSSLWLTAQTSLLPGG